MESSNFVTHFTKKKDTLFKILDCMYFKPSYCKEETAVELKHENSFFTLGVPEVSFCDIPLSRILNHVKKYGCYGISLTKKWAINKGLSPIIYMEKQSKLAETISANEYLISTILAHDNLDKHANYQMERLQKDYVRLLAFIKNYSNDLRRKEKVLKDYRFYDEREWRYVPDKLPIQILPFGEFKEKDALNSSISDSVKLEFSHDDIDYIILDSKKGIDSLLNRYKEKITNLASKTITIEQLKDY